MSNKPSFIKDLSLPTIAAPMFLISGPKLVIECCKNGIVGTFLAMALKNGLLKSKLSFKNLKKNQEKRPLRLG